MIYKVTMRDNRYPERAVHFGNRGVTLIELLVVMAVISILVGFGVWGLRAAQEAQSKALAKAQVNMIAAALDQFKSELGFYPPMAGDFTFDAKGAIALLFNGAVVTKDASGNITGLTVASSPTVATHGPYLDIKGFSVTPKDSFPITDVTDPWGNPFQYGRDDKAVSSEGVPVAMPAHNAQTQFQGYMVFSWGPRGEYKAALRNPLGISNATQYVEQFCIHPD